MAAKCPRCGHNFYDDAPVRDGLCKWCVQEVDNPDYCYVCGAVATCSSSNGFLCDDPACHDKDSQKSEKEFQEKYGWD